MAVPSDYFMSYAFSFCCVIEGIVFVLVFCYFIWLDSLISMVSKLFNLILLGTFWIFRICFKGHS